MATATTHYSFRKPGTDNNVSVVTDLNDTLDAIDSALKANADSNEVLETTTADQETRLTAIEDGDSGWIIFGTAEWNALVTDPNGNWPIISGRIRKIQNQVFLDCQLKKNTGGGTAFTSLTDGSFGSNISYLLVYIVNNLWRPPYNTYCLNGRADDVNPTGADAQVGIFGYVNTSGEVRLGGFTAPSITVSRVNSIIDISARWAV